MTVKKTSLRNSAAGEAIQCNRHVALFLVKAAVKAQEALMTNL